VCSFGSHSQSTETGPHWRWENTHRFAGIQYLTGTIALLLGLLFCGELSTVRSVTSTFSAQYSSLPPPAGVIPDYSLARGCYLFSVSVTFVFVGSVVWKFEFGAGCWFSTDGRILLVVLDVFGC
jgi:hypothetical protein